MGPGPAPSSGSPAFSREAAIALSAGDRLGPYEIVGPLGAGGMGEVYRARDSRLRRDVALKVLPSTRATPEHVERFSREARAAGALNHPNILAVFDIGSDGAVPYVVSELLEGETLRQRLDAAPIPYRKALDYGIQVANGLAAAHGKGIYHRDVKPANIFITTDGRVKLLDFGLAKLDAPEYRSGTEESTASGLTEPGSVYGTVGYMAPEQVVGGPVDHRADIFAVGAVLYEMMTGARAFQRSSPAETMAAVLKEEAVDPLMLKPALPPAAAAAIQRCLEKNREERFQSARDLSFHLQQLQEVTWRTRSRFFRGSSARRMLVVAGLLLAALAVGLGLADWIGSRHPAPSFRQLTFRPGRISGARLTAAGFVVYSKAVEGRAPDVWQILSLERPESRPISFENANVLATRADDVALCIQRRFLRGDRFVGTLAVAGVAGGAPRGLRSGVEDADWDPLTATFAVACSGGVGEGSWLEYPMGSNRKLFETLGSIHGLRISRDGRQVAFLEDSLGLGRGGRVWVVDRDGKQRALTDRWFNARGLSWSPDGDEIWFTAATERANRALRAVNLAGKQRVVLQVPGSLTLWDVSPQGRLLLTRDDERTVVAGKPAGGGAERDLALFDTAGLASVSRDGKWLLFSDRFGIYLRPTDGSAATRLGLKEEAYPDDLSPDGAQVLATGSSSGRFLLVPTGLVPTEPGNATPLRIEGIESFFGGGWFPDGRRIFFSGREPGHKRRSYVMELPNGPPRPLTSDGHWALAISPDGRRAAATAEAEGISLWPVEGGRGYTRVPGSRPGDRPEAWHSDGRSLWVFRRGELPATVDLIDIKTGRREQAKRLMPADPTGVYSIDQFRITPNGDAYFYSYRRILSELYLAEALR